ncbi:MAG: cysteine desulfurase [Thermoplasmata archaeon]|nr:cysteine desulfurase [Thermoplasmata archaeon]
MPLTPEQVREHIPFLEKYVYLDNGATTPVPLPVQEAMSAYYNEYLANVERGAYSVAHEAHERFERARENAAKLLLGCEPGEFVFTRNLTHASNIVAYALEHPLLTTKDGTFTLSEPLVDWKSGGKKNIVGTMLEHHSNTMPWLRLAHHVGAEYRVVRPSNDMVLSPDDLLEAVDGNTRFVAFQHVSNVLGSIHPVREITRALKEAYPDIMVFIDGSQGPGHLPVDVKDIGCDFYGFSGHKGPLGPQGTGGLYIRKEVGERMDPMEVGGGMMADVTLEGYTVRTDAVGRRFDAGTPNIPGMIGLGRAAEYVAKDIGMDRIDERERHLAQRLIGRIKDLPGVKIYGPENPEHRGGVVTFTIEGWLCHDVSNALDDGWRILTRSGHHCCLPLARWLGTIDRYGGTTRASMGYYNMEREVDLLAEALESLTGG